jgi:hypothetical protein
LKSGIVAITLAVPDRHYAGRTKARLEDIVAADRGKVVQRAEVAPP